jgi:hypothetical protein
VGLERLRCRGNENQPIEVERFACIGGQKQVADVGRIESAAEDRNTHWVT